MIKFIASLFCVVFLFNCSDSDQIRFEKRIVGDWWRCKYISGNSVMYDDKDVSKSNDIISFDGKIFKEYYRMSNSVLLLSWTYSFDGDYLNRHNKLGSSGTGRISYINDTLIIDRVANNADERLFFVKYSGELPPLSWPQNVAIDTTTI
jgi:hypothetical protein